MPGGVGEGEIRHGVGDLSDLAMKLPELAR
jgi:hypothetical protein